MSIPVRLLLVAGTSIVGHNILAALDGRRSDVFVAATGSVDVDLALFDFDAAYHVPATAERHAFFSKLTDVIEDVRPHLIVPCRDEDVLALSELRERRADLAPAIFAGSSSAAAIICDKWESWRFCEAHGLPFVASAHTGPGADLSTFADACGFPLIAKPRHGFGSRGVRLVTTYAQLRAVASRPDWVVQPFFGDRDAVLTHASTVDAAGLPLFHSFEPVKRAGQVLVTPDGATEGLQCTRNTMAGGFSTHVAIDEDPALQDLTLTCARAFAATGWRGPFNMQCVDDGGGALRIHEFNGRLTGATAAQLLLGQDDVGLAIERFTGRSIRPAGRPATPVRDVTKLPHSYAVDRRRLDQIRRTGKYVQGLDA